MTESPFVSFGQNREDVVLWRALGDLATGRYVEVGANDPVEDSMTKVFHDRGWSGLLVEPVPEFATRLKEHRPLDIVVQAAVVDRDGPCTLHTLAGTGLSTVVESVREAHSAAGLQPEELHVDGRRLDSILAAEGWDTEDVHLLVVDAEGAEAQVLDSVDLTKWRPWVMVVESTFPNSREQTHTQWEPILVSAGYRHCLFDGVSRFYVAEEHAERLAPLLSYPACALDSFVSDEVAELKAREAALTSELLRWRRLALQQWAKNMAEDAAEVRRLKDTVIALSATANQAHAEVGRIHDTLSWKVTKPLRAARRLDPRR